MISMQLYSKSSDAKHMHIVQIIKETESCIDMIKHKDVGGLKQATRSTHEKSQAG